jgi:hypothetical protein
MNTLDLFRQVSAWNTPWTDDINDTSFVNLQIENDAVVGFYKTRVVKYKNTENEDVSYLFPTTFRVVDNVIKTTMTFGSVERNFILPSNINGVESYPDSYTMNLKTVGVGNHLYNLLIAEMYGFLDTKPFVCIIEDLNNRGFPFIRITSSIKSSRY